MPFTFAHPAAVLPLKKYCPKFLNLPAMMAGTLTPDIGYYTHNWIWSMSGHSFLGSLKFDVPAGLILTAIFYLCIRPIARLLPYPHREACSAICPVVTMPTFRSLFIATISVLLGAWTHIIWDGFTHANGWCVRELAPMTPALFKLGSYPITIWQILQHGSTLLGLTCLFISYKRYAYGKRFTKQDSLIGTKMQVLIWILLLIPPAVYAIGGNGNLLRGHFNIPRLDEFVFSATIAYICVFLPLASAAGVLLSVLEYVFLLHGRTAPSRKEAANSPAPLLLKDLPIPVASLPPSAETSAAQTSTIGGTLNALAEASMKASAPKLGAVSESQVSVNPN